MYRSGMHNRPWFPTIGRRGSTIAFGCLLAVGAAGCGQREPPELGTGVAGPTTLISTTTTIAATTTTTINFDRPVTQGLAPLGPDAGPTEVADLVADLRGQSDDVAVQVMRLAPFLAIRPAAVAQIMGIDVTLAAPVEGRYPSLATVRFRVPAEGPDLVRRIDDGFQSLGWFTNSEARREVDGGLVTESAFRNPGFDPGDLEFRSSVATGTGPTVVELTYLVNADLDEVEADDGTTYFERLAAWQAGLSFSRVAELTEVGVETVEDAGTILAHYRLPADSEAEAVALLVQATAGGDFELLGASADDPPPSGPLRLVDEAGAIVVVEIAPGPDGESFEVEAAHRFDLAPLD